jgi:hypothetical protein
MDDRTRETVLDPTYLQHGVVARGGAVALAAVGIGAGVLLACWGASLFFNTNNKRLDVLITKIEELAQRPDSADEVVTKVDDLNRGANKIGNTIINRLASIEGDLEELKHRPIFPTNPGEQKTVNGNVITKEVTVFHFVKHESGGVFTGWRYPDGASANQKPINQFCYWSSEPLGGTTQTATIRVQRPETAPWHYVNIPIHLATGEPATYDANRDCPNNDCVVAKIAHFDGVLADRQFPERERLEALKYLVHFIGDVHQPLHASNNNDRGGNEVAVTFMGRQTNLHAVWDTGIIEPAIGGDERGYALQLVLNIKDAERKLWPSRDPVSWANEAHEIAVAEIYGKLNHAGAIPESYEVQALSIVNEQLAKAGVRLAVVLNELLK